MTGNQSGPPSETSAEAAVGSATTEQNRLAITEVFKRFVAGDQRPFFALVHDEVKWTVIGSTAISGRFDSKRAFIAGATSRLFGGLDGPLEGVIKNILADGDHVIVQWTGSAPTTSGGRYDQTYCWVMRLEAGMVVETTAYLDTEMVSSVLA